MDRCRMPRSFNHLEYSTMFFLEQIMREEGIRDIEQADLTKVIDGLLRCGKVTEKMRNFLINFYESAIYLADLKEEDLKAAGQFRFVQLEETTRKIPKDRLYRKARRLLVEFDCLK